MDSQEFRAAGHRLVDWIADYFQGLDERPGERRVFPEGSPRAVEALFDEPLPQEGVPPEEVLRELDEKLLPHCTHVGHPGYFGLITPSPTPMGVLGDLLASALNQNIGAYSIGPGAVALERRVVRWLCTLAGYGPSAGGHLTSGGMLANFVGLKLARDAVSGNRAQHDGLREPWAVYVSEERHVSLDKAVDALGLGRSALRALPTDERFAVRLDALEAALAEDRRRGIRPLCLVGIAGTTNTGAIDDLAALRRIADRESLWLHVDAAYGGGLLLSQRRAGLLAHLALADSIAIDPHKWFYAPLDAGAVLVRDGTQLRRSFAIQPAYLKDEFDTQGERFAFYLHGFEQSRRFRGLKVWMSFKRYGARRIGAWVDANLAHAERLHQHALDDGEFVPAMAPPMSAVCLRYAPRVAALAEPALDELHARVVERLERDGRFWISTTRLKGRTYFRINPVNFRTRAETIDALFAALRAECARALAEQVSAG